MLAVHATPLTCTWNHDPKVLHHGMSWLVGSWPSRSPAVLLHTGYMVNVACTNKMNSATLVAGNCSLAGSQLLIRLGHDAQLWRVVARRAPARGVG